MLSCCCRSRHTNVLRRLGSLVVSVICNCRSVEKCFSVSLTSFPSSQLFCSIASTLGACPIFLYWTLFTPTYLAQLIAGTSNTDGSCSDPDPISPSSTGVHCCWLCVRMAVCSLSRFVGVVDGPSPRKGLLSIVRFSFLVVGSLRVGSLHYFVDF